MGKELEEFEMSLLRLLQSAAVGVFPADNASVLYTDLLHNVEVGRALRQGAMHRTTLCNALSQVRDGSGFTMTAVSFLIGTRRELGRPFWTLQRPSSSSLPAACMIVTLDSRLQAGTRHHQLIVA
jgi:hypothetical protein